jgi:hypothetical protein
VSWVTGGDLEVSDVAEALATAPSTPVVLVLAERRLRRARRSYGMSATAIPASPVFARRAGSATVIRMA